MFLISGLIATPTTPAGSCCVKQCETKRGLIHCGVQCRLILFAPHSKRFSCCSVHLNRYSGVILSPLIRAHWRLRPHGRLTTFLVVCCGLCALFYFYVSISLTRLSSNNVERNAIPAFRLLQVYSQHSCNLYLL